MRNYRKNRLNSSVASADIRTKIEKLVDDAIMDFLWNDMNDHTSYVSNTLDNDPAYDWSWAGLINNGYDREYEIDERIDRGLKMIRDAWVDFYLYHADEDVNSSRRINSSRRRSRLNSSVAYKIIDKRHQTPGAESGFVIPESDLYRELDKIAREQYGYDDEREIRQFMFDVTDGIHPDFVLKETTLRDDYDGYYR